MRMKSIVNRTMKFKYFVVKKVSRSGESIVIEIFPRKTPRATILIPQILMRSRFNKVFLISCKWRTDSGLRGECFYYE